MEVAHYTIQELGVVAGALMILGFVLIAMFRFMTQQNASQAQETAGSQQITQQALTIASNGIAELSVINRNIQKLLEHQDTRLMLLPRIEQHTSNFSAVLTTTQIEAAEKMAAAVLRVETPIMVLLASMNEGLPMVKEIRDYFLRDRDALLKQIQVLRNVKITDLDAAEPAPASPPPAGGESAEVKVSEAAK